MLGFMSKIYDINIIIKIVNYLICWIFQNVFHHFKKSYGYVNWMLTMIV